MKPYAFFIRVLNPDKPGHDQSEIIESILSEICVDFQLELVDATDVNRTGRISNQILRSLENADVVFADANTSNENIWYEIGYTHALNTEKLIYFFEQGRQLPFDISDHRGIAYSMAKIANRSFHKELIEMLDHLLSHGALARLLKSDHYGTATAEYISIRPQLKDSFITYLKESSLNIDNSPELRRRSIDVLLSLGYLDDQIAERLSKPLVEEHIRQVLFDRIAQIGYKPTKQVWLNGLEEKLRHPVLRDLSRGATSQFLKGNVEPNFFESNFVKHENWVVRKHVTINLLDSISEIALPMLKILTQDLREEVIKRFVEWFDKTKSNGSFTSLQKKVLEIIQENWKGAGGESKGRVAKEIGEII